jgi:GNAT superfamily N-acetyltransferase
MHHETHLVRFRNAGTEPGLTWFATGAPQEELNEILEVDVASIGRAKELVGDAPALWHVWPGITDPSVEAALVASGLAFLEEEPLMVARLSARPASTLEAPGIAIAEAVTRGEMLEWVRVWLSGFDGGDPHHIVNSLTEKGYGPGSALRYLTANQGDHAVASLLLVIAGNGASAIEHVVTVPEQRRRGIGALITSAALDLATAEHAHSVVLTASQQGEAVYRRLGFEQVGTVRRFRR